MFSLFLMILKTMQAFFNRRKLGCLWKMISSHSQDPFLVCYFKAKIWIFFSLSDLDYIKFRCHFSAHLKSSSWFSYTLTRLSLYLLKYNPTIWFHLIYSLIYPFSRFHKWSTMSSLLFCLPPGVLVYSKWLMNRKEEEEERPCIILKIR